MRIAQIAPIIERVPPKKYGGTERVVYTLTEELVKRGHDVTLFASGDSVTSAKLRSVYPRALREGNIKDLYGMNYLSLLSMGLAYDRQNEFDVIHDHLSPMSLPVANVTETPVVTTMHGAFNGLNRKLFQLLRKPHVVTISKAQAHGFSDFNHAGTVYNGLSMGEFPFEEQPGDYLLFVGRISMEKGTHIAIEVATELDMPLIIAAKVDDSDRKYFRDYVEPRLSDRIRWIGEVDTEERNRLMSKAFCLLHPITWREPFGLVLIEAAACGCPVVALNHGSIPEIVQNGVTGFVTNDTGEMIDAVQAVGIIDRKACREYVLHEFSAEKMADGYEKLYASLVGKAASPIMNAHEPVGSRLAEHKGT